MSRNVRDKEPAKTANADNHVEAECDPAAVVPDVLQNTGSHIVDSSTQTMKIASAVFYAIASFLITVVNKSVLTSYRFPSFMFLSFGQMIITVLILYAVRQLGFISFPDFSFGMFTKIFPLQFMYMGSSVAGLGSTQKLSLPMFTVLRRMSILMTMIGEYWILNVEPSLLVQLSVYFMIVGAVIAAVEDLAFNLYGYAYVTINNFFAAGYNVIVKQKLNVRQEIGKYGLLYYCALFMSPVCFIVLWLSGDLRKAVEYENWGDILFLMQFSLSCVMGFILVYSLIMCTHHNSALTTTIIGCLKNILITYLGVFIGGDYVYSLPNFIGINISVLASLLYTWISFKPANREKKDGAIV